MSTPYTLMRCRMKDLISCFKACKVPIEEDDSESEYPNPKASSIDHQLCESEEDEYIVFYFRDEDRRKKHETQKIEVDSNSITTKFQMNECSEHESEEHKDALGESSDSSTSSFAFPTMQCEWTGSPVLMPRPEGDNKTRRVCIQCCKF